MSALLANFEPEGAKNGAKNLKLRAQPILANMLEGTGTSTFKYSKDESSIEYSTLEEELAG